jgi:hypothetical protein
MIINKASYERGFAHASVFYSLPIDLRTHDTAAAATDLYFAADPSSARSWFAPFLCVGRTAFAASSFHAGTFPLLLCI